MEMAKCLNEVKVSGEVPGRMINYVRKSITPRPENNNKHSFSRCREFAEFR